MYREINQEIYQLKEKLRNKEKLESLRDMGIKELNRNEERLKTLEENLKKEEKDVLKLEGMSLSSFFFNVIGKKEDKLDKERREYLAAKLQFDELALSIKELNYLIKEYDEELLSYVGVEEKYKDLLDKKQSILTSEDTESSRALKDLLDKLDELKLDIKEVKEAIAAGRKASKSLIEMKQPLESAQGWGVWDILGGGFFSDLIKHSKIDDANKISYHAQQDLSRFLKELSDVNEFTDIKVNIGSFAAFADFFFDGLFADWFVQSKINESLSNVRNAINNVENILQDLDSNLLVMERQEESLKLEINKILEI